MGREKGLKARATTTRRGLLGPALMRRSSSASPRPSTPASTSTRTTTPPAWERAGARTSALGHAGAGGSDPKERTGRLRRRAPRAPRCRSARPPTASTQRPSTMADSTRFMVTSVSDRGRAKLGSQDRGVAGDQGPVPQESDERDSARNGPASGTGRSPATANRGTARQQGGLRTAFGEARGGRGG